MESGEFHQKCFYSMSTPVFQYMLRKINIQILHFISLSGYLAVKNLFRYRIIPLDELSLMIIYIMWYVQSHSTGSLDLV